MERNPYTPPESTLEATPTFAPSHGPEGLGGWLILWGIFVVVAPIKLALVMSQVYPPIFSGDVWHSLTTPGSPAYHRGWAPYLVTEIVLHFCLLFAWLAGIVLFFRKSRLFPRLAITLLVSGLPLALIDSVALNIILPNQPVFSGDTVIELARGVVGAAIWIPYMLVSVRVKNTFVHRG